MKRSLGFFFLTVSLAVPLQAASLEQNDSVPAASTRTDNAGAPVLTTPLPRPDWRRAPRAAVSEPSTLLMMALGLLGAARFARR